MNTLEWIAALFIIASVIMLGKASVLGWVFSAIGCAIYGFIFAEQTFYANTIVQIIFVLQSIYGIFQWKKNTINEEFISVKFDSTSLLLIFSSTLGIVSILSVFLYSYMFKESSFMDIVLSICSLFATIMIIKRIVHAWFFWMAIDIGYIFLFIKVDMYVSAGLYLLLFLICIKNYMQWNKKTEDKTI